MLILLGALITVPLGDRLGLPPPVLMTLLGIVLALLPFVPDVDVPPDIVLPLLLPPLLYAAVRRTSWRQFAANWRPIFLLAVALVFVTTAAVAVTAHALIPGLPIAAAAALGALVAPPDPVAATAVAGRWGCPDGWCRCWRARACSTTSRRSCSTRWRSRRRSPASSGGRARWVSSCCRRWWRSRWVWRSAGWPAG